MWGPTRIDVTDVEVRELPVPTGGVGESARREHCELGQDVIDTLGLTLDPELGVFGQVRAFWEDGNFTRTGSFTVIGVAPDDGTIRVYASGGGDLGGLEKLTGTVTPGTQTAFGRCTVVWPMPSAIAFELDGTSDPGRSYTEPFTPVELEETAVEVSSTDDRLAVLAPHGGGIERFTDDQVKGSGSPFQDQLGQCATAISPALWVCEGQWREASGVDDFNTHDQLHVTAPDIDPRSFPGLGRMLREAPHHQPGIPFQWAVALHGFGGSDKRVIVGGQAPDAVKTALRTEIGNRTSGVTVCVVRTDGTPDPNNPSGCTGLAGFGGTGARNLVNRLAPNPGNVLHRGALQLEQSSGLRNDAAARDGVARAVAAVLCDQVRNAPHVYVRHAFDDTGEPDRSGPTCLSPDLCYRHHSLSNPDLDNRIPLDNETLRAGEAAYLYVRLFNRSTEAAPTRLAIDLYHAPPATLVHPGLWQDVVEFQVNWMDEATGSDPDQHARAWTALWWPAPVDGHRCLVALASDVSRGLGGMRDVAAAWDLARFGRFVRECRWTAWRNSDVLPWPFDFAGPARETLRVTGFHRGDHRFRLGVTTDVRNADGTVALTIPESLWSRLADERDPAVTATATGGGEVRLEVPRQGTFTLGEGILPEGLDEACELEVGLPGGPGGSFHEVDLFQEHEGREVGRIHREVRPHVT